MKKLKSTILVMYHGQRVNWNGVIYQLFRDQTGIEYKFKGIKIKGVVFSDVVEMVDNQIKCKPEIVEPAPWMPTEMDSKEYQLGLAACSVARLDRQKAMQLKRPHKDIQRAIELLRPFYRSATDNDRRRFMEYVANECSKKPRKK